MEERIKKYRYSEIFGGNAPGKGTIQGEGHFTGHPTVWVRWWGCNLNCLGYGQKDLDKPETWEKSKEDLDISKITKLEELPVFHTQCDSAYSWMQKYIKFSKLETSKEICNHLEDLLKTKYNTNGLFQHPNGNDTHLAFTGGEPMMSQHACLAILEELKNRNNFPKNLTIETNGTQSLKNNFAEYLKNHFNNETNKLFWSCSPKLYSSGEKWEDAIKPEILRSYNEVSNFGQLKYVVDGSDRTWYELKKATDLYRLNGINWSVWCMPVGADLEMQTEHAAKIAHQALERGYNVAARVHTYLFGNAIGT